MTVAPTTSNPPTLQNAVPQHHHRHNGGASNDNAPTSAVTPASSTPSDGETVEEPAAPTPTMPKGGVNILA